MSRIEFVDGESGIVLFASDRATLLAAAPEYAPEILGRVHDEQAPCYLTHAERYFDVGILILADRGYTKDADPAWFRALISKGAHV